MPVKKLCPELHAALLHAEVSNQYTSQPFEIKSSGQTILPYFIPLSNGGMLVKLDDHAHIRQQFQQLKLASLGRLSASIAHEIRNPLGAISQAVQLIQESPAVHPKDAELLDIASRHTQRINRIVEDVLQLSNRRRVASEKLQMNRLLDSFCKRFRKENQLGPEELVLRVTPGLDGFFDASHLDQILWNLCTNARLHNDESELTIAIIAHRNEINQCVIDVTDTGRGISDIDRERLFEPFYSSHDQGTGLGLYIIRELCELNNGQIECLPSEMGAHFRLTLPTAGQMAA
ncbi:MAG: hypothetical protein CSA54_03400 [Gammaproteobacteria bacterium]|nr:MAG: hypothetical protein CSA54_03400 [Gammaproteobacteria bacterium]